jgi:tripartite-type tricarboxylate transporter receptor subunit TctC
VLRLFGAGGLAAGLHGQSGAQGFPARAVTVYSPYSAGSGPDAVLRNVGELIGPRMGQPLVVLNQPGANGWIAIQAAKKAQPDGHSLLIVDNTHFALQPHLYKKLPFDPGMDFIPVAALYSTHFFVIVSAKSEWQNIGDLLAAAKARPGAINYGSWGLGSVAHVGTSMLEAASGTQMLHAPFKEQPTLYTAVANGEIDWAFGSAATVGPLYQAKKVKLLAIAAPQRVPQYGDVPTVSESGGPAGFELKSWAALFAPRGTPIPSVEKINAEVRQAVTSPSMRERFATMGFQPWSASPAQVADAVTADSKRFLEIVKRTRISLD